MVSAEIMPRSATRQTRPIEKRCRKRSTTGSSVVTSAVLPSHISVIAFRGLRRQRGVDHIPQPGGLPVAPGVCDVHRLTDCFSHTRFGLLAGASLAPRTTFVTILEPGLLRRLPI